jgi:energy-coupling factor transporter ATP-binding protein EcfA2
MDLTLTKTTTEAEALEDIVQWSLDKPLWQRDALRRLLTKDTLSEQDFSEILAIAKGAADNAIPITTEHIPSSAAANQTVNICGLNNVQYVNALEEGQSLSFQKGVGITVVYGDNGSGKSGYARILKSACRARIKDRHLIKPNIYNQNPGIPNAEISFSVNDQNQSHKWKQGQQSQSELSAISVFDANTASVHVDEENDVAYIPFPLELLSRLSKVVLNVQSNVKSDIKQIQNQTPQSLKEPSCTEGSEIWNLVKNIHTEIKIDEIDRLSTLTEDETKELEKLNLDLSKDPIKQAQALGVIKQRIQTLQSKIKKFHEHSSSDSLKEVQDKFKTYQTKKQSSKLAAEGLFQNSPIKDVGSDVWLSLWEAARNFSEQKAYPKRAFPNIESDSSCVLCQQPLSDNAKTRLTSFDIFVKDDAKKKELESKQEYESLMNNLRSESIGRSEIGELMRMIKGQLEEDALAKTIKSSLIQTQWRMRAFKKNVLVSFELIPPAGEALDDKLSCIIMDIQKRIDNLSSEENSERRTALINRLNGLNDRKWLNSVKKDFLLEVDRQKTIKSLSKILNEAKTRGITDRSTEISNKLVNDVLRLEFAKEVGKLNLGTLGIELNHSQTKAGSPLFAISLIGNPREKRISAILSEGEFRCIALAAFLAEQATSKSKSTLVFDDPVCSLDHMHREDVANRLSEEGQNRQIIVFTHDLAFLFLLESICRDKSTNIAYRWIHKTDAKVGLCKQTPPIKALPVSDAIQSLENDLNNKRYLYDNGNHSEWISSVNSYQIELRMLWERAVEQAVSPVVKRFKNKVETVGLIKLTVINEQDCTDMREGYSNCSQLLHTQGDDLTQKIPHPDKVKEEITRIKNWVASILSRQRKPTP